MHLYSPRSRQGYSKPHEKGLGLRQTPTQNGSMKRLRNAHYYQETLVFIRERSVMYISAIGVRNLGVFMRYYPYHCEGLQRDPQVNTAVGTRACCIVLETVEKRSIYARNACIYQETLNDVYSTTYTPLVLVSTTYTTNFMLGLRQTLRGSSRLRQTPSAKRQ